MPMNTPQPLVSVIIPTYNRPEYLKQAISSAIRQTYQNIEIIVSDNCSSENPQSLVESFQDKRIKFWRHSQNIGMLANQLHTFKMASGKYVASLHDDDIWDEDFLTKLVPPLEASPDLILAFCDQYVIDGEGKIDHVNTTTNTKAYQRDQLAPGIHPHFIKIGLIDKSIPTASACVLRNALINWDLIPAEVHGMWDLYLTYLCLFRKRNLLYCGKTDLLSSSVHKPIRCSVVVATYKQKFVKEIANSSVIKSLWRICDYKNFIPTSAKNG